MGIRYEDTNEFLNDQSYWQKQLKDAINEENYELIDELISDGKSYKYEIPSIKEEDVEHLPVILKIRLLHY